MVGENVENTREKTVRAQENAEGQLRKKHTLLKKHCRDIEETLS